MDMIPPRLTSSARKEGETYLANLLQLLCTQQQEGTKHHWHRLESLKVSSVDKYSSPLRKSKD